jgi:26S proteasome regulatory subunit N11
MMKLNGNFHVKRSLTRVLDIEDVGQQLIEDNIVSVSRQMIDKEASVAKTNGGTNGHQTGSMEVDEEL